MHALARLSSKMLSARLAAPALLAGSLLALPARAEGPVKIGYFDVKHIITEVDDAKAKKAELQSEFNQKQKQLDDRKNDIEKLQGELKAKSAVLSQSAKEQMQGELQQKMGEAQQLFMQLQQELGQKEQTVLGELIQRLEPVVREVAEANSYTYVFEKNEAGLFYAPAGHDLTSELIRKYNLRYPSKGGSAKVSKGAKKDKE